MIFLASIIYLILNLLPKLLLRKKYLRLEEQFNWKIPLFKLSGLVSCLLLTFLLIFLVLKLNPYKYIENKNAIYGLEFNQEMHEIGFENGMKIISINNRSLIDISEIAYNIINEPKDVKVIVEKEGIINELIINNIGKMVIVNSYNKDYTRPILTDKEGNNPVKETLRKHDFFDILSSYKKFISLAFLIINPFHSEAVPNFIFTPNNIQGYTILFSINLLIIGIINLFPFPGSNMGNFIVSLIESLRKKLYNRKLKLKLEILSISIVLGFLLLSMHFL